jgi:hypothetical protein
MTASFHVLYNSAFIGYSVIWRYAVCILKGAYRIPQQRLFIFKWDIIVSPFSAFAFSHSLWRQSIDLRHLIVSIVSSLEDSIALQKLHVPMFSD